MVAIHGVGRVPVQALRPVAKVGAREIARSARAAPEVPQMGLKLYRLSGTLRFFTPRLVWQPSFSSVPNLRFFTPPLPDLHAEIAKLFYSFELNPT
jgi:hypothetical protein